MVKRNEIAFSAAILAYELGCSVYDLRRILFEKFESEPFPQEKLELLFYEIQFSADPCNTPSGIMLIMMRDYLSKHHYLAKENPDLFDQFFLGYGVGDIMKINEFFDQLDISQRYSECLVDDKDEINHRKIINIDELITSLYHLCNQGVEKINKNKELSKDGKFEALLFVSSIIMEPELYYDAPFIEIRDRFQSTMINYAIENGIHIDIAKLPEFIFSSQQSYFIIMLNKTHNSDYVLNKVFARLYESPVLSGRDFILNNIGRTLLSKDETYKSVMIDFTNFLMNEVVCLIKSEVKPIISKYIQN